MATIVDLEKCHGCGVCVEYCSLGQIAMVDGVAVIGAECCNCEACIASCALKALSPGQPVANAVVCTLCGVGCQIAPGLTGVCQRFTNVAGELHRNRPLQIPQPAPFDKEKWAISQPLITGVGAGATYPDYKPAPYIVASEVEGVDVVTVVTEAPITYSTMLVKVDTDMPIGQEGSKVRREGKVVGMVTAEQYGSHMLTVGGVNLVKGRFGATVVRTMAELGNGDPVTVSIEDGSEVRLQAGQPPVVDGKVDPKMRVACGAACCGLFAPGLSKLADEIIILDHHITGLFTGHPAGREMLGPSGVEIVGRRGSPGRYFLEHGRGWGGTDVQDPRDAIKHIDLSIAKPGMRVLVAETTWQRMAMLVLQEDGSLEEVPVPEEAHQLRLQLADNCEETGVSVLYYAGVGGSARAGVTVNPLALNRAVHRGDAVLTIGGAPAYVLPGGGISFLADVQQMVPRPFSYSLALPAVMAPVEYTIEKSKYAAIGGHIQSIRPLSEVLKEGRYQYWKPPVRG